MLVISLDEVCLHSILIFQSNELIYGVMRSIYNVMESEVLNHIYPRIMIPTKWCSLPSADELHALSQKQVVPKIYC